MNQSGYLVLMKMLFLINVRCAQEPPNINGAVIVLLVKNVFLREIIIVHGLIVVLDIKTLMCSGRICFGFYCLE